VADFADDGVIGGEYDKVLKVLKGEIALGADYGIRNNFSKMVLYPLAGRGFCETERRELDGFRQLGVKIDYSCNVKFMQVPVTGNGDFMREWAASKMDIIRRVLHGVRELSSRHVALYLLKGAGDACRVVYYLRTVALDLIQEFGQEFDGELRAAFEEVVGFSLSEKQWDQAALPTKLSGMGLCRAADIADAAYLASRAGAYDDCQGLDGQHVWDDGRERDGDITVLGEWPTLRMMG
jgi:hypothetical protein